MIHDMTCPTTSDVFITIEPDKNIKENFKSLNPESIDNVKINELSVSNSKSAVVHDTNYPDKKWYERERGEWIFSFITIGLLVIFGLGIYSFALIDKEPKSTHGTWFVESDTNDIGLCELENESEIEKSNCLLHNIPN